MISNEGVLQLAESKRRLEEALAASIQRTALIRKKVEALDMALSVLRANDDDLGDLLRVKVYKPRVKAFDEAAVEAFILERIQQNGPLSYADIGTALSTSGHVYSEFGLKRILRTSPNIVRIGEREKSRYQYVKK